MSTYRLSVLSLFFLFGAGCSSAAEPLVCGESFCLPKGAKIISRQSPVEDFNLYRVEANANRFVIYEGNHPQRRHRSVVLTVGKDWPAFLEVSGPCASKEDCAVRLFAAKIAVR
jgi:hypothetical protein